ncbi:MAG: hypothetical protein ACKVX7_14085 [Planctomycetota bacterium]
MKIHASVMIFALFGSGSFASFAAGQFTLEATGGALAAGGTIESQVLLTNAVVARGFQYYVTRDTAALDLIDITSELPLLLGAPAEFDSVSTTADSILHAAIFSTLGPPVLLPVGTDQLLSTSVYAGDPAFNGTTALTFAGGDIWVLDASLVLASATLVSGVIEVEGGGNYEFSMVGEQLVPFAFSDLRVLLDSSDGLALRGWSYGVSYVAPSLAIESIQSGATTATIQAGGPPDFEQLQIVGQGFIHSVDIDVADVVSLPPGGDYEVLVVTLETIAAFSGNVVFNFDAGLGVPVQVVPVGLAPITPTANPVVLSTTLSYLRGDCNDDGSIGIADVIYELSYLFSGAAPPHCDDACDTNDDGQLGIADAIYNLSYLFGGGPRPPASASCSPDLTPGGADALDCDLADACG